MGVACDVIAPSLVPVRAGDRVKIDRRDAKKLVRLYRASELSFVEPPAPEQEGLRDLVRAGPWGTLERKVTLSGPRFLRNGLASRCPLPLSEGKREPRSCHPRRSLVVTRESVMPHACIHDGPEHSRDPSQTSVDCRLPWQSGRLRVATSTAAAAPCATSGRAQATCCTWTALARQIAARLPQIDLADALIDVDAWTEFSEELTHAHGDPAPAAAA